MVLSTQPREIIDRIREQTDIVELVSSYLPLRRAGRNFKACCPFHEEKTPSFNVNPERQIFKCFGCGEGGDVFDFVMLHDRLAFGEAVELLASRCGVELAVDEGPKREFGRKDLYRVLEWAWKVYRRHYEGREGEDCRRYVEGRGISPATAEAFGLGFAPPGGDVLVRLARAQGVPQRLLEAAGLAQPSTRGEGLRDRFWDARLVFPIRDPQGRVVAFGGRILGEGEPKYINSPETELFHKGRMLFGLDRLSGHKRGDPILVVEGYTDVIVPAQAGLGGVVATLGTSLTPDHARLLSRYGDQVVLIYDGDRAGLAAAERGVQVLVKVGHLDLRVVVLPEGVDPCDLVAGQGPAALLGLVREASNLVDFLLDRLAERHDLTQVPGRHRAAEQLVALVADLDDPVAVELILSRTSTRLGIGVSALEDRVRSQRRGRRRPSLEEEAPGPSRRLSRAERAQHEILQALVNDPALVERVPADGGSLFPDESLRALFLFLRKTIEAGAGSTAEILAAADAPETREKVRAFILEGEERNLSRQLEGAFGFLKNMRDDEISTALRERCLRGDDPDDLDAWLRHVRARKGLKRPSESAGGGADG